MIFSTGFHGVDLDSASVYDIHVPLKGESIRAHSIIPLPGSNGRTILLCYEDEGAYFSTAGKKVKDATIRWGEPPHSVGKLGYMLLSFIAHQLIIAKLCCC